MSSAMESCLIDSINASLKNYMYRNAVFLCERLYAENASEENLHLLATCYFRNNQAYRAYHLLKGAKSPQCRYLFALASFEMGHLSEAEAALLQPGDSTAEVPNGAAGYYMLGLICRLSDRTQAAIGHYTQALSLDPFFWSAFEDLCLLGVEEEPATFFGDSAGIRWQQQQQQQQHQQQPPQLMTTSTPMEAVKTRLQMEIPAAETPQKNAWSPPARAALVANTGVAGFSGSPQNVMVDNLSKAAAAQRRKFLDDGKLRKVSGRLFAEPAPRRSLRLSADSSSTLNLCSLSASSPISAPSPPANTTTANTISSAATKSVDGVSDVLALLRTLGEGFKHLSMYESQEALEAFSKLPQNQYETAWVLCQVGRAYFEMVDYVEAERAFIWARRLSPHRLEGMDIYSTVLYHMRKDVELSYLAQEAVSIDRLSPHAWCVIGNCFSLQKDHETALKHFQRALQLDPHFTYAHTLSGHEYVAMEDYEEGLACYRNATRLDVRHYNAWYGLGTIYLRQEKYELAEYHFRRAIQINERSSVLHCYLGMALHALKRSREALELLEDAMRADPKNPLPKYQKANVLISVERYDEALAVLEQLKEVAPRESSVYFLMGKVYKRLGSPEKAMYHFCVALDLKPSTSDVNLIKVAIEKLSVPDGIEEDNL